MGKFAQPLPVLPTLRRISVSSSMLERLIVGLRAPWKGPSRCLNTNQSTCLMHRRTSVLNSLLQNSSPEFNSAKQPQSALGKRPQSFAWATTPAQTGRYRLELLRGAVANALVVPNCRSCDFGSRRIQNNQSGRCEHQAVGFRSQKRGIAPDVVRRETGSPRCCGLRACRSQFGSEIARVCFLRHFTLAQPYF